jgi:hypothetical protein
VTRDGSPAAATLAAARGALSERRPIANDVLNLSALTGARSRTAGDDLTMKGRQRMSCYFAKPRACRKKCYLPQAGEAPLPFPRRLGGASTAPTGTSVVLAGTSTDDPATGGSVHASRFDSTTAPSARGDGGAGSHLSKVVRSPSLSSSSEDEFANADEGERPCCSRCWYSSLYWLRCSCRLILLSFARAARSRFAVARCGGRPGIEASTGPIERHGRSLPMGRDCQDERKMRKKKQKAKER